jgi:hypothetical protein
MAVSEEAFVLQDVTINSTKQQLQVPLRRAASFGVFPTPTTVGFVRGLALRPQSTPRLKATATN